MFLELSIQRYSRTDTTTFSSQKLPAVAPGCMGAAALEAFDLRPALCGVSTASRHNPAAPLRPALWCCCLTFVTLMSQLCYRCF